MSLRAVQELVVHFESFRNIDLWYQGAYMLKLQLYTQKENIYAHPFAFTEQYMATEQQAITYDNQILKPASIDAQSSSFLSKAFLLRYYEQQVELNDICHFRIETDISRFDQEFILEVSLLFFDQQIKKLDPLEITVENGKVAKTSKYVIKKSKTGIHQYAPIVFGMQYYSVANIMIHSVCLDYRFRLCKLQLFEFVKLNATQKKKLLDKNRKMQSKDMNYFKVIASQLNISPNSMALHIIEDIIIKDLKKGYHALLKQYSTLFARVINEQHRKKFPQLIVPPSQLGLFQDQSFARGNTWEQKLYKRYKSSTEEQITQKMLNETNLISAQMIKLWHHYIDILKMSPRFTTAHYQEQYQESIQNFWQKYRKYDYEYVDNICVSSRQIGEIHQSLQKQLSINRDKITLDFNVINQEWILKKNHFPLMVENYYQKVNKSNSILQLQKNEEIRMDVSLHLIILVHGFQGNSLDMKIIKNNISVLYPQASFLCATSNQDMTDTDIIEMGNRLAAEIKNHILEFFPPNTLQRISFVGHSLGGVIIRAALPRLLQYKSKFHTFMTFSTPHIGYKVNASSVVEAGIWVLQKFKNSICLRQLTMEDYADPRQTVLYRISKFEGLKYFKNIFLFSSKQDSYAPYESARIEIHPDFMNAKDPLKQVHCEMVRNILGQVAKDKLRRIRVNFTIQQTNFDSLIGRTAHILFLENCELIQLFLHTHPDLFC